MKWLKRVPTKPGIYLRKNPPASRVIRQDVVRVGSRLCTTNGDGGLMPLADWHGARSMWWFGPIPNPPEGDS